MNDNHAMNHGSFSLSRQIKAPRALAYKAWTSLEHRRNWFVGPAGWKEVERRVDLRIGGQEVAHGRMDNGVETIYSATFHLVVPDTRLIYAFDMHVAGQHFSVSLAGVDFADSPDGTLMTYTEQAFYLADSYGNAGRIEGTNALLDQFTAYLPSLL